MVNFLKKTSSEVPHKSRSVFLPTRLHTRTNLGSKFFSSFSLALTVGSESVDRENIEVIEPQAW